MKWLKEHGTEWVKVCAEPGDLLICECLAPLREHQHNLILIGDSRTPHYNLSSMSSSPRFCVYTCYMPVSDATQEDLVRKKAAFEGKSMTSRSFLQLTNSQPFSERLIGRTQCTPEAMSPRGMEFLIHIIETDLSHCLFLILRGSS